MTKGVDADFFMVFHEPALVFGNLDGGPDASFCHGVAAVVEGLFEGDAGAVPATTGAGKEPVGVAVPRPEGAEALDECGGNGDFAWFAAFGVMDSQDVAFAIDVFGADV